MDIIKEISKRKRNSKKLKDSISEELFKKELPEQREIFLKLLKEVKKNG